MFERISTKHLRRALYVIAALTAISVGSRVYNLRPAHPNQPAQRMSEKELERMIKTPEFSALYEEAVRKGCEAGYKEGLSAGYTKGYLDATRHLKNLLEDAMRKREKDFNKDKSLSEQRI